MDALIHIVLESIVVIMDILRKYPNQYEGIVIPLLCDNVEDLANPRAKAAMIWILAVWSAVLTVAMVVWYSRRTTNWDHSAAPRKRRNRNRVAEPL